MRAAWDEVKLHVVKGSDVPDPGTVLLMTTGRRYQVLKTSGRQLRAIVLPADHDTGDAPVWAWRWASRASRPRHTITASTYQGIVR